MKRFLVLLGLLSFVALLRAQVGSAPDPTVGRPVGMSVSLPAELPGKGDVYFKITLHYAEGGKHQITNYDFKYYLLDENGDQVKQGILFSNMRQEVELEGTDPVYTAHIGIDTQNKPPLTTGARYQLVVILGGVRSQANVKTFKVIE